MKKPYVKPVVTEVKLHPEEQLLACTRQSPPKCDVKKLS